MKMTKNKKILSFAMVALMVIPVFMAITIKTRAEICQISYNDDTGYDFHTEITISGETQINELKTAFDNWYSFTENFNYLLPTKEELQTFIDKTSLVIEKLRECTKDIDGNYNFPLGFDTIQKIKDWVYANWPGLKLLGNDPVQPSDGTNRHLIGLGQGKVWMPFKRQGEFWFGIRKLVTFVGFSKGYALSRWWYLYPPSFNLEDRFGMFFMYYKGFKGMYINIGELFNKKNNFVLFIGEPKIIRMTPDAVPQ